MFIMFRHYSSNKFQMLLTKKKKKEIGVFNLYYIFISLPMLESVQQSNDVEYSSIYLNISNIIE